MNGYIKKIIYKIIESIKNIFKKENVMLLKETEVEKVIENNNSLNKVNDADIQLETLNEELDEKKEFFELYEKVKNGKIDVENLIITDLIKVLTMSQQELDIFDKILLDTQNEAIMLDKELQILKEENRRLRNVV